MVGMCLDRYQEARTATSRNKSEWKKANEGAKFHFGLKDQL
jgi:hypothetical protein